MKHLLTGLWATAGLTALGLAVPAARAGGTPLTTVQVASGLAQPLFVTHAPGDFERLYVVQRNGVIRVIKNGVLQPTFFLNISGIVEDDFNEQGLLGLAFHPDFQNNGFFYVNYTRAPTGATFVSRFTAISPDQADAGSEQVVISFAQPFPNHNGGWIGFGPDGMLYVATGDGGSAFDPGNRAQDITDQKLGKILRLDINGDDFPSSTVLNYANPPDNPFVGITGDDEIWAYGLRNPWRCSFDRLTGDLWIADVGQDQWEEVNFQPANAPGSFPGDPGYQGGHNYGWRCMEGMHCTGLSGCTCFGPDLTLPIHEYSHTLGCSVTGGYVYRGCGIPDLQGTYFFADFCSSRIWSFRFDGTTITEFMERTTELDPPGPLTISQIASFGEDAWGELYIVSLAGSVYKIVPDVPGMGDADGDGVPDNCESACAGDVDGDGSTGPSDLGILLGAWGTCSGDPGFAAGADLDQDGCVGPGDLGTLLGDWGCAP